MNGFYFWGKKGSSCVLSLKIEPVGHHFPKCFASHADIATKGWTRHGPNPSGDARTLLIHLLHLENLPINCS